MSAKQFKEADPGMPRIEIGMRFTVGRGAFWWVWQGEKIHIPIGTRGEVVPRIPGSAVKFEGIKHPAFDVFPRELSRPGEAEVPEWMHVISRSKASA